MAARIPPNFRRVITAASGGNVIEWYDFYIFGSLAAILSVKFFEKSHPVAALLSTIALFTAGFLIRPLGAFLFGWMGDRVGRKYTFLVTLSGMALGTGAIGLIPTFESIGLAAAVLLFCLRMIQGLCLGGQYGGAITYVAEHVSDEYRGYYTGWLQTSPTLGIVLSLLVIIAARTYLGEAAFNDWGWRIPFLFSFLLMIIAYYIRVHFQESPIFEEIKAKAGMTKNPWKEAFLSSNIKLVLIASIVVIGEGVVWYSGQFSALYFLQQVSKLDALTTAYIVGAGLIIGTPTLILFGWLSDLIGRKPVILGGFLLAALTYYPLYTWLGSVTQPGNVKPHPLHVGLRAVSHRQWLGRRVGALHYCGRVPDRSARVCADLPDRGSSDMLRAQPVPDAGDSQDEHLGAGGAKGVIDRPAGPVPPAGGGLDGFRGIAHTIGHRLGRNRPADSCLTINFFEAYCRDRRNSDWHLTVRLEIHDALASPSARSRSKLLTRRGLRDGGEDGRIDLHFPSAIPIPDRSPHDRDRLTISDRSRCSARTHEYPCGWDHLSCRRPVRHRVRECAECRSSAPRPEVALSGFQPARLDARHLENRSPLPISAF